VCDDDRVGAAQRALSEATARIEALNNLRVQAEHVRAQHLAHHLLTRVVVAKARDAAINGSRIRDADAKSAVVASEQVCDHVCDRDVKVCEQALARARTQEAEAIRRATQVRPRRIVVCPFTRSLCHTERSGSTRSVTTRCTARVRSRCRTRICRRSRARCCTCRCRRG
jgi:hypothetical protein